MRRREAKLSQTTASTNSTTPLLSRSTSKTISWDELDDFRRDNHFIKTGYRRTLRSYHLCWGSIFEAHNETWTHLVGSAVALATLVFLFSAVSPTHSSSYERRGWLAPLGGIPFAFPSAAQPSVTLLDSAVISVFFLSAATCLGFSASFHTLTCHSMEVAHRWNKLDYIGIVVLISGTFVPAVRYGFFCDPHLRNIYITLIYLAAAGTAVTVLSPHARTPEYRRFRAWVFIALGTSAVFPVVHAIIRYGFAQASRGISLPWLALGGLLYITGAILYAERCPERLAPGAFDFIGSSHQIFHVMILLAAFSHWCAIAEGFRFWHGEQHGVCLPA